MRFIFAILIVLASTAAHAQPGTTTPVADDEKNPAIAVMLSTGLPVLGLVATAGLADTGKGVFGVFAAGALVLGPSTGRWYAGEVGAGMLALRALGAVTMVYGIAELGSEWDCDDRYDAGCPAERERVQRAQARAPFVLAAGTGLWLGTTIADIVLAKRAADRRNKEHAMSLTPGLVGTGATHTPGLVLSGRF